MGDQNLPAQMTSGLPAQRSHVQDDRKTAALLKLSSHYWRPDATPTQAAEVIEDFMEDLSHLTPDDVERACMRYRMNQENRFFPTPGQLLGALKSSFDLPKSRLPAFRPYQDPERRATKSVAEILAESGQVAASDAWRKWKYNRESSQIV